MLNMQYEKLDELEENLDALYSKAAEIIDNIREEIWDVRYNLDTDNTVTAETFVRLDKLIKERIRI